MIFSTAPAYRNCHQRLLQWANRAARFANEANCFNPITLVIARARSSSAMSNFYAAAGNTWISINVSRRHWGQSQCIWFIAQTAFSAAWKWTFPGLRDFEKRRECSWKIYGNTSSCAPICCPSFQCQADNPVTITLAPSAERNYPVVSARYSIFIIHFALNVNCALGLATNFTVTYHKAATCL